MSILDRLSLLVRSQVASNPYDDVPGTSGVPVVGPRTSSAAPTPDDVQRAEQQALDAAAAGDRARAQRLAAHAAALEFGLTSGRFGAPASGAGVERAGALPALSIPANPYGIANPPVAVAPALRPTTDAPPGGARDTAWYDAASPQERFDRYTAGGAAPYGRQKQPPAGTPADDVLRTLRNLFDPERP